MNNPLPQILQSIPYTECLLDLDLADKLCEHLSQKVSNAFLVSILIELHNANLIELKIVQSILTPGTLVTLKRL